MDPESAVHPSIAAEDQELNDRSIAAGHWEHDHRQADPADDLAATRRPWVTVEPSPPHKRRRRDRCDEETQLRSDNTCNRTAEASCRSDHGWRRCKPKVEIETSGLRDDSGVRHEEPPNRSDAPIEPATAGAAASRMQLLALPSKAASKNAGVYTFREQPPVLPFLRVEEGMVKIRDDTPLTFPSFAGCPDWVKPLMYEHHQVR